MYKKIVLETVISTKYKHITSQLIHHFLFILSSNFHANFISLSMSVHMFIEQQCIFDMHTCVCVCVCMYIYIYKYTFPFPLCWLGLEYTDYILYRWIRHPPLQPKKRGDLNMTLNCIWWCGSISVDLEHVEYLFTAITPRFTLTWSGYTC